MKSKRKIFICCVMSLMMALVMAVPMSVSAAEGVADVDSFDELKTALADASVTTINVTAPITSDEAITISRDLTITGESITFNTPDENSMTIVDGAAVNLNDIKIANTAGKSVIHVYGSTLTAANLTVDHDGSTGAPILVNNGSTANFTDLNLELGANSWYGVNVDGSEATFSGVTTNGTTGTQSVICEEDNGTVNGSDLTIVETADGQTAYVEDSNLPAFVAKKTEEGKNITEITLQKDLNLSAPLYLGEAMTVNGGYTFKGTDTIGKDNVVTITAEGVVLDNVGIKTSSANKSALHVYKVPATLINVTLDNTETAGGAGLVVNSATVTVEGNLNIKVGDNSWGGINVDARYGNAGVTFADGAKVNFETTDTTKPAMYEESQPGYTVTIDNAEGAGLVENENGTYSPATGEDPTDPSTTPGTDTPSGDKTDATPQTGDDTNLGLMFAIMGIAAAAAAGTLVYGRRRHNN